MSDSDSSLSECEDITDEVATRPSTIYGQSDFVDLEFHPKEFNLLGAVNLNGYIAIYQCENNSQSNKIFKKRLSKSPCRCVAFSSDGSELFSATKDKIFYSISTETGKIVSEYANIHGGSPYSLAVIDRNLFATGDEDGELKVWDKRKGGQHVMADKKFDDYVSSIAVDDRHRLIFAVSGDGTMCTYNARQRKFVVQSEIEESELLCAKVMKDNKKLVVGTGDGPLHFYNWDEFAAISDRFPGHPGSVNHMAKVTEDILCTASSDGMIRAVHILPNSFLGVVGEHKGIPVEKLSCTNDGSILASCSHDSTIKFWNVEHLKSIHVSARAKKQKKKKNEKMGKSGVGFGKKDFLNDLGKELNMSSVESQHSSASESDDDSFSEDDLSNKIPVKYCDDS